MALQAADAQRRQAEVIAHLSREAIRSLWKKRGGGFYGPNVEHATIKEDDFWGFVSDVEKHASATADAQRLQEANDWKSWAGEREDEYERRFAELSEEIAKHDEMAADAIAERDELRVRVAEAEKVIGPFARMGELVERYGEFRGDPVDTDWAKQLRAARAFASKGEG